ncbi:hypothetical protein JCM8097_006787 [Rhodosporidiobolus ruineniae]
MSAPPPPPPGFPIAAGAPPFLPPVPPPWTEHRAPAGQPYWFNPITNVSTYTRPGPPLPPPGFSIAGGVPPPPAGFPVAAPAPAQQLPPLHFTAQGELKPGKEAKKEKKEKPKEKLPIEGTPWIRVTTNKGNVFFNNKDTKESVWTTPEEIKAQVEEIERKEREAKEQEERRQREEEEQAAAANGKKRKADDELAADANGAEAEEDEQVKGDLDLEIEGANGADVPEEKPAPAPAVADEPPKKKKQKKRVVSSLEELMEGDLEAPAKKEEKKPAAPAEGAEEDDDEEAWQRELAAQMAAEAEEAAAPKEEEKPVEVKPAVPEVDQVEAAALYRVLLSEKDINPMAPFETELPKFVADPRYHAVRNNRDRRDIFEEFCKEKIREQRAAKKKLAESGKKVDPLTAYRALLTSSVTSTRTHFSDFKRAHAKDARFREFGKTEGDREKEFKKFLRELGETKRKAAEKAEGEFAEMLREDKGILPGDKWAEVKKRHANDPRYAAVNSSSLREQLFTKHLSLLTSGRALPSTSSSSSAPSSSSTPAPTKEDKAARAAASLREREEKVRMEKMRAERETGRARGNLGKEEAEREFGELLVQAVRDHKARFDDLAPTLARDSRFDAPSLHPSDKRRLFAQHVDKLHRTRLGEVEALFARETQSAAEKKRTSSLVTRFEEVLPSISKDPHVTRFVGEDFDALEDLFRAWLSRRAQQARAEFDQMLQENAMVQHWGRLKKKEKTEKVALIGQGGEVRREGEVDEEDEEMGLGEMAEQVDMRAIHAVLRQDKRYLEFNHVPEDRERWIEEYVDRLAAPKMTMHQRD